MAAPYLDWKDAETDYCRSLVMVAGTREVPDRSVRSYLEVQIASATRDQRLDVVEYLTSLLRYWARSPRCLQLGEPS